MLQRLDADDRPQFVHFPTNISTLMHSLVFMTKVLSK